MLFRSEIKRLSEEPEYVELHMLTRIFHAIVDSVRPPVIEREALPPQEVRTFSIMSTSEGNQETCYGDLSGIDTEDDMEYEEAVDIFDQPNYWEDTSDATISPNAALRNKDMQRKDQLANREHKSIWNSLKTSLASMVKYKFRVKIVRVDGEGAINTEWFHNKVGVRGIVLDVTGAGEAVAAVERKIRYIKERVRSVVNSLPFSLNEKCSVVS